MNNVFRPCAGKNVCIENKTHCLSCGRKLTTIAKTRKLIEELANLALKEDYNNVDFEWRPLDRVFPDPTGDSQPQ